MIDPHLSYAQHKQAVLTDNIALAVHAQTQKLIANNEQLARRGIQELIDTQTKNSDEVLYELQAVSSEIGQVSEEIIETRNVLSWGLDNIYTALNTMEHTLGSILDKVADTDRAWAYAQYGKCLENYRRELHSEAIERIEYAINGFGNHIGEKEDYRFHFLLGSLRLGRGLKKPEQNLIDSKEAEKAFLNAAKYSEYELKAEAAKAYLNAGISAYSHHDYEAAHRYVVSALSCDDTLVEAQFFYGKLLCEKKDVDKAFSKPLKHAIAHHPLYAEKALFDTHINTYQPQLEKLIITQRDRWQEEAKEHKAYLEKIMRSVSELQSTLSLITLPEYLFELPTNLATKQRQADEDLTTNTLDGSWRARHTYASVAADYASMFQNFCGFITSSNSLDEIRANELTVIRDREEKIEQKKGFVLLGTVQTIYYVLISILPVAFILDNRDDPLSWWKPGLILLPVLYYGFNFYFQGKWRKPEDDPYKLHFMFSYGAVTIGYIFMILHMEEGFSLAFTIFMSLIIVFGGLFISGLLGLIPGYLFALLVPSHRRKFRKEREQIDVMLEKDSTILLDSSQKIFNPTTRN